MNHKFYLRLLMNRSSVIAFLLSLLAFNLSASESCRNVNLKEIGGSMEQVKVPEGQIYGSCYAFAAAQAIDAYRRSSGEVKYGSDPTYLTLLYVQKVLNVENKLFIGGELGGLYSGNLVTDGGNVSMLLKDLTDNQRQFCTTENSQYSFMKKLQLISGAANRDQLSKVIGQLHRYHKDYNYKVREIVQTINGEVAKDLERLSMIRDNTNVSLKSFAEDFIQLQVAETKKDFEQNLIKLLPENGFENFREKLIAAVLDGVLEINHLPFLNKLVLSNCQKESLSWVTSDFSLISDITVTQQMVNSQLKEKESQPIAITYCFTALKDGLVGTKKNSEGYNWHGNNCGVHASLIIGSRQRGDSCQYLLRNSKRCKVGEIKNSECDKDSEDTWVDRDILTKNLLQLVRLRQLDRR